MKYAINYSTAFKHSDAEHELILQYNEEKHRTALLNYVRQYAQEHIRFIIAAERVEELKDEDFKIFAAIMEIHPNIAVRISLGHKGYMVDFVDKGIPFFFDTFVDNWDILNGMIKYGVSDVYIVNEFAFDLPQIRKVCGDVKVRVFPNVAQSSDKLHVLPTINSFYIRPEDIPFYEPYVDVCEFFGPADRHDVLFRIYTEQKWIGNLKELIIGLQEDLPNTGITPHFGDRRVRCKKACNYNNCNLCNQIMELAILLNGKGVEIKHDK